MRICIVCTLDGPIPRPGRPYPRWHGDKREVSFDHLYEFHEVWLSIDPKGTFTVQRHNLQAILQRLNRPLGIAGCEPPFTDAQLQQYIGELNFPDHGGQVQFLETLSVLWRARKVAGASESFFILAAQEGGDQGLRVAKLLLDAKADIDEQSKEGSTALYAACQCFNAEMVRLLLERGANKDLALSQANRALHNAEEVVALLAN